MDNIRYLFFKTNVHIIIASETWFKSCHSNAAVAIDGYRLFRNDRVRRRSGGVAVYIRNDLKCTLIISALNVSTGYIFLDLIFPNAKILVGGVYKAPSVDDITLISDLFSSLSPRYEDGTIAGDFNENLLLNASGVCLRCAGGTCSICRFRDVMNSVGLRSVGDQPTHFPDSYDPTQLDLFLSNNVNKFSTFTQITLGLSAHNMLLGSYEFPLECVNTQIWRRDLDLINIESLLIDAESKSWADLYSQSDSEMLVSHFNAIVTDLLDTHSPLRLVKTKSTFSSASWFSSTIKRALLERDIAYALYRRTQNDQDLHRFRQLRNKATLLIKNS